MTNLYKLFKMIKQLICSHRYPTTLYIMEKGIIRSEEVCMKCKYVRIKYDI